MSNTVNNESGILGHVSHSGYCDTVQSGLVDSLLMQGNCSMSLHMTHATQAGRMLHCLLPPNFLTTIEVARYPVEVHTNRRGHFAVRREDIWYSVSDTRALTTTPPISQFPVPDPIPRAHPIPSKTTILQKGRLADTIGTGRENRGWRLPSIHPCKQTQKQMNPDTRNANEL
jgi:hypothetical protein